MLRLLGRYVQLQSVDIWASLDGRSKSLWRRVYGRHHEWPNYENPGIRMSSAAIYSMEGKHRMSGGDRDVYTGTTRIADLLGVAGCASDLLRRSVTTG